MNNPLPYTFFRRAVAPVLIFLFIAAGTSGCMHFSRMPDTDRPVQYVGPDRWIREELYFGSEIPISKGGGVVTDTEWQEFVDTEITPRFPKGLTTLTAQGQYRYADGALGKEKTWIVIVYYFGKPGDNDKPLDKIITLYKTRFQQESVMRVSSFVDVEMR